MSGTRPERTDEWMHRIRRVRSTGEGFDCRRWRTCWRLARDEARPKIGDRQMGQAARWSSRPMLRLLPALAKPGAVREISCGWCNLGLTPRQYQPARSIAPIDLAMR